MSKNSKLIKNIVTFAVGNLGSKIIAFVMLPFYTHLLSREEYGEIDLFTNTLFLILPLITLNLIESIFRFCVNDHSNRKSAFTSVIFTCGISYIICLIIYFILGIEIFNSNYDILFLTLLFLFVMQSISKQFVRALQKLNLFMASDLVNTVTFVLLNLLLIGKLSLGINGYLISMIIAYAVDCIILLVGGKLWSYIGVKRINPSLLKDMIKYAAPLIPNALMWWVINISDRYIINYYLGVEANGIYSVAVKLPSIIYMLYMVFNKAWQISAIEENNSQNMGDFYSGIFKIISTFLILGSSIFILFNKVIIKLIVSSEFYIAWKYTPFLVIGVIFSAFASFAGTSYTTSKKTKGALISSFIAAITNIVLNLVLVPFWGIQGACISTALAFLIMFVVRILDTKKYIELKFNKFKLLFSLVLLILQVLIHLSEIKQSIIYQLIILSLLITVNFKSIKKLYYLGQKLFFKLRVRTKQEIV